MAEIKPLLGIQLDLTRPVEELVSVIIAVLNNYPQREREILVELDTRIGNFLARQEKGTELPEEGGEKVGESRDANADNNKQPIG